MMNKSHTCLALVIIFAFFLIIPAVQILTSDNASFFEIHDKSRIEGLNSNADDSQNQENDNNAADQSDNNPIDKTSESSSNEETNEQTESESSEEGKDTAKDNDENDEGHDWLKDMNEVVLRENKHYCDLNGDGLINHRDLYILLAFWGPFCGCEPNSPDVNDDEIVNVLDLLEGLAHWGPCCGYCPWDLNCDETVSIGDIKIIEAFWGAEGDVCLAHWPDLNEDCVVNVLDLLILLAEWGSIDQVFGGEIELAEIFAILDSWGEHPDSVYDFTNDGIVNAEDILSAIASRL